MYIYMVYRPPTIIITQGLYTNISLINFWGVKIETFFISRALTKRN